MFQFQDDDCTSRSLSLIVTLSVQSPYSLPFGSIFHTDLKLSSEKRIGFNILQNETLFDISVKSTRLLGTESNLWVIRVDWECTGSTS